MTQDDIRWLNQTWGTQVDAAIKGTWITKPLLYALACQETGFIWANLRKTMEPEDVLRVCVGDTLDAHNGRTAFPKTAAELLAVPRGAEMLVIAREALLLLASHFKPYQNPAANQDKFCHAFGIFQRDLQAFREMPQYFLEKQYENFSSCLGQCLEELHAALFRCGFPASIRWLTDEELCHVAIAYNAGRFSPSRGLKQGYFDGKLYYGEHIMQYMQLAKAALVAPASA